MSIDVHNDVANHYYSGQGVVMIAQRDALGNAGALIPIGNVSALKIMVANTVNDHKGAQDGQRAIDKRLVTETKVTVSIDLENINTANLATGLRGTQTVLPAGTVTAVADIGYVGAVSNLGQVNVAGLGAGLSTVGTTQPFTAGSLVEYSAAGVAYDFTWNSDAGSFALNNPAVTGVATSSLGFALGSGTGATTTAGLWAVTGLTASPAQYLNVGDTVTVVGVTGGTGNSINFLTGTVTVASATTLSVQFATTLANQSGLVLTSAKVVPVTQAATGLPWPVSVTTTYTYGAQRYASALINAPQEMFLRFEGLNTADVNNTNTALFAPVVVEIFRFSVDPLKELDLINDAFSNITIEGAVLADATKTASTTQSKFFRVQQLY